MLPPLLGGLNAADRMSVWGKRTHTHTFLLLFAVCEIRKCQFVSDMKMKGEQLGHTNQVRQPQRALPPAFVRTVRVTDLCGVLMRRTPVSFGKGLGRSS